MKQGETSEQRELGGRKEISCHSKSARMCFGKVQRAVTEQQQPKLILNE